MFPVEVVLRCTPTALVFPRLSDGRKSVLTPMDLDEALGEMAPNVLLTETQASERHLDALLEVVRSTSVFRLETGDDFDQIVAQLKALVA